MGLMLDRQVMVKIDLKIQKFGRYPERLYLGLDEWDELRNLQDPYMSLVVRSDRQSNTYQGLNIYIVDEQNHLFVG